MNAMTPHSDQELLAALGQNPEIKKYVADKNARDTAGRQKIIDTIAALDAKAARELAAFKKVVQTKIVGVREAEKTLRAANDELSVASFAESGANLTYSTERQSLEVLLRLGVDADLFDNFQREMRDEVEKTRKKFVGGYVQMTHEVTRKTELRGYNNSDTVNARLAAIRAAMEEAERLRISADQTKVAARLDELRAGLPEVGEPKGPGLGDEARA